MTPTKFMFIYLLIDYMTHFIQNLNNLNNNSFKEMVIIIRHNRIMVKMRWQDKHNLWRRK